MKRTWSEPNPLIRNRAELCIAQGSLTNSKRPSVFIEGIYPTHAKSGRGVTLITDEGRFIDYCGALGSNLYGYGNYTVINSVTSQLMGGSLYSLGSHLEVEVAERLKGLFSFVDLWKFGKNGSDVAGAALKIARAYTGRDLVLSDGYHGFNDDFISMSPPALGIPRRGWIKPLVDNWDLIPHAACVIIEPVILDYSLERKAELARIREECTKHGTVLIFDEIITGFRFKKLCVAKYFGIEPDLILLGKAMGGGLPLSAVGGKKELMNCGEYFYSGTFFGDTVALAACRAVIEMNTNAKLKYSIDELWSSGQYFLDLFNALDERVQIVGYPTRGAFQGDERTKALFWQEAAKAKILFGPSWFFGYSSPEFTELVINVCRDIFNRIKSNMVELEGQMPKKPFAQSLRERS